MRKRKWGKAVIWLGSVLLILGLLIILFISPIAKYLIEKYDEEYTGRQIEIGFAYVNPFTGFVHLKDVTIYEAEKRGVFFMAEGLSVNFTLRKFLSNECEITAITLDHPRGIFIQKGKLTNLDDVIEHFSKKDTLVTEPGMKVSVLDIKVIKGEFHYRERAIPINYFIKEVDISSKGKAWDADTMDIVFSFLPATGGSVKTNMVINTANADFRLLTVIKKLDLDIFRQYLIDLANYGTFSGNLDAGVKAEGNFKDKQNLHASGLLAINEFHLGKSKGEDYLSFDKLILSAKKLDPRNRTFNFDSISLQHPYFKYEKYDHLDNLQNMFGKGGSNIKEAKANSASFNLILEIGNYVKLLAKNIFSSTYTVHKIAIRDGDLLFNDYSQTEKFSMALNPLSFTADSVNSKNKRVKAILRSGIKPYGNMNIAISIDPRDSTTFEIDYRFRNLPLTMFNPYIISFTSFPLDRGTIELSGDWRAQSAQLNSTNHLVILDPRLSKRLKGKDKKWIPMPFAMYLIRERGNVIDYEIPITGSLKDPKFRFKDAILDLLKNIFVKPATTSYTVKVRNTETEVEKSFQMKWERRSSLLQHHEKKFIEMVADFLKENPEASISVLTYPYQEKEKEAILLFEAKKKYFLVTHSKGEAAFDAKDSIDVERMSSKDSVFVKYVEAQIKNKTFVTIQQKCLAFVGQKLVNSKYKRVLKSREETFSSYFKANNTIERVKIVAGNGKIPYNGFSYHEIKYKGDFPESLREAYEEMNEINNDTPRRKYLKDRKRIAESNDLPLPK